MKRMTATTLKDHERRITALERNAEEVKETLASHSESLYTLKRGIIRNDLGMNVLLDHFGLARITEKQVDGVLDAE